MENGDVDGVPLMKDQQQYARWKEINDAEFQQLVRETRRGHDTLIDSYGATNPIEFFAVATETFFEEPKEMSRIHPYLYDVFREFYRQDPATRATVF